LKITKIKGAKINLHAKLQDLTAMMYKGLTASNNKCKWSTKFTKKSQRLANIHNISIMHSIQHSFSTQCSTVANFGSDNSFTECTKNKLLRLASINGFEQHITSTALILQW